MAIQLSPARTQFPLPSLSGSIRLAASWRRDGGTGVAGQFKKLRGMNLDLVLTGYRQEGDVVGLFHPGSNESDWVWMAHDEKRGGRPVWDESALVDLDRAPAVVSRLTASVVAYQPGTSFDQVPLAKLDLYGPDSDLLIQSEMALCAREAGGFLERVNIAVMLDLERRKGGGWMAVRDARWGYAEPGSLSDLKNAMECLS